MSRNKKTPPPEVVLVVNDGTTLSQIEKARRLGVSILEIRVDQFLSFDDDHVRAQLQKFKRAGLPLLGTVRSAAEGGNPTLTDSQRKALLLNLIPRVNWVDLELSSKALLTAVTASAKKHKTGLLLSFHDFHKTPSLPFLEKLLERCKTYGPDRVKIAVYAKNAEDLRRLLEFTLKHRRQGLVTLSMGPVGALSRVFFGAAGSAWTYTFLSKASAPGQLPLEELSPLIRRFYV